MAASEMEQPFFILKNVILNKSISKHFFKIRLQSRECTN